MGTAGQGTAATWTRRLAAVALTPLLLVFGGVYAFMAGVELRQWSAMSGALVACLAVIALCGCLMLVTAFWLMSRLYRDLRPLWLGGVATALCGIVLAGGAIAHVIPCSGPS